MTITVAALKRAAEECAEAEGLVTFQRVAFEQLCQDPTMLTILAQRLSVRTNGSDTRRWSPHDPQRPLPPDRYGDPR